MFVLIYSDGNTLSTGNDCRAYESVEKARAVMEAELERVLTEDGYSVSRKVECAPGFNDLYGNWAGEGGGKVYLGFLNDFDAYLEDGEHRWVIHELPGLFVPQEDAGWVRSCLRDFGVGQTNFEASETALEVCNVLKKYA